MNECNSWYSIKMWINEDNPIITSQDFTNYESAYGFFSIEKRNPEWDNVEMIIWRKKSTILFTKED